MKNGKKRNFELLGVGIILFAILIVTPALADSGQFTGCLGIKTQKGTLYNIQAGSTPMESCSKDDVVISFYDSNTVNTLKENAFTLQTRVTELEENVNTLQDQVNTLKENAFTLQTKVTELEENVNILQSTQVTVPQITALQDQVNTLNSTLQGVTRTGNDIYITGANLHIRSGSGRTDGPINGLGNLIIGYNEVRGGGRDSRTGSHNLILGKLNNYESYGGLVAGYINKISAPFASVSGGNDNTASGDFSSVSGGYGNKASGKYSSVSGYLNTASGIGASVSGGSWNTASGMTSSVSGGYNNTASRGDSSVSGGSGNIASGIFSSISGGEYNTASSDGASVSGGSWNTANGGGSSVSGGYSNTASGDFSSVSGSRGIRAWHDYEWRAG